MSTFEEFIKTGKLGKIALYSSLSEVESTIGKTDEILQTQNNMFILKYDYLQLTFQENVVKKIHIRVPSPGYNSESLMSIDRLLDEPWTLTTQTNLERFIDLLYSYEPIPFWEIDTKSSIGTQLCLIVERKVKIFFELTRYEFSDICV